MVPICPVHWKDRCARLRWPHSACRLTPRRRHRQAVRGSTAADGAASRSGCGDFAGVNERAVKFNILPTGTTLGAGVATASNDPVTHNTLSAEQKLYGPLQVTTAVTDFSQATSNKSITAGFKVHW